MKKCDLITEAKTPNVKRRSHSVIKRFNGEIDEKMTSGMKSTYYHFIEFPDISPCQENANGKSFSLKKPQSNNKLEMPCAT